MQSHVVNAKMHLEQKIQVWSIFHLKKKIFETGVGGRDILREKTEAP